MTLSHASANLASVSRQRGTSIFGLVIVVLVVGFLVIVAARVVPTFVEYRAIQSAVSKATATHTTVVEVQKAFDRSAAIDDITSLASKDLTIEKVDDEIVVTYAYTKKIPLFGPVSLTIDYAGRSKSL
ncbi:MAG: DUF4845 domain-containing protein [Burkholderiaceae bacterium]